ncbi:MAG: OmpA family protein [Rikenellaceae bacterium]|nr:OmpA family protein [Rikenellaceae bacterium]
MKRTHWRIIGVAGLLLLASSCVSTKKHNLLNADLIRTENERDRALGRVTRLEDDAARATAERARLQKELAALKTNYADLRSQYSRLVADNSADAARMLGQIEESRAKLAEREARMAELEQTLRNREEALNAIRRKVADALLGFEGKGLTITQRDGKVYVSMEEKLLFRSGSFDIDPEGARAVRDLSTVLAQNPDINVMVEGHTDSVSYRGSGNLKDNWDLSMKRATTVTRLILENQSVEASRITAAGRGEFLPLAPNDSPENRQRNRRTEIILTPKLDELLQLTAGAG